MDDIQRLAVETIKMKKQAIVFAPSRASAEKSAEEISKLTNFQHPEMEEEVLKAASSSTKQCRRLSRCVRKGIAFHHAGLVQKQKDLIEDEFRSGKIKVICCTPTLAAGM
ncbi:DEAD/DEAH box helicase, partial [Candidatus Woesearchaeota archaeon]|nr:DEAD/DEAH box helicase [Candidatus Woesearchaeota archaeon]